MNGMATTKRSKKLSTKRASKRPGIEPPKTLREYRAMPRQHRDLWNRIVQVPAKMRTDRLTLEQACRELSVEPGTVTRLARSAFQKNSYGKHKIKKSDRLLRVVLIPTTKGLREIATRDSREARLLGKYWAAVHKYFETGDSSALRRIRRKTITDANGKRIPLIKDLSELDRLGSAGVLSFESLYGKAA
jgi:hypothetical protein